MASDDYCLLTTTGRRTGRRHEIEIWYADAGDRYYVLAGGGRGADWVANLAANPSAEVRTGLVRRAAVGRLLDGPGDAEEARLARDLVYAKYQPRYEDSLDDWRERSLPVALDLGASLNGQP